MTQDTQQAATDAKTWCIGRFLINLPAGAKLAGGSYKYNFARIERPEPMSFDAFEMQADAREAELRSNKHEKDPSLLRAAQHPDKATHVLAFWEDYGSDYVVEIEGQRWVSGKKFLLRADADKGKQDQALARMADRISRLRPRPDDDIPTEPGYCFEGGFVADAEWKNEHVGVDFQLPDMPDAFLSVTIFPKVPDKTLLERKSGALRSLGAFVSGVQTLREGDRAIGPITGQEILMTVPNSGSYRGHLFLWETQGEGTLERPYIEVKLGTGHSDGKGNAQRTRLTDEAAIKLWDAIVSTLRIRPTGPARTSEAPLPKTPLGEFVRTGEPCPQTGWWQCPDGGEFAGGNRRFLHAGTPMPPAVTLGPPSLLQRFTGERPRHAAPTAWELVAYAEEPPPPASPPVVGPDEEPV